MAQVSTGNSGGAPSVFSVHVLLIEREVREVKRMEERDDGSETRRIGQDLIAVCLRGFSAKQRGESCRGWGKEREGRD